MASGQLWLFPPPKPLVERLGEDFFARSRSGRVCIACVSRPSMFLDYGELVRPADAARWFGIVPDGEEKLIPIPAAAVT